MKYKLFILIFSILFVGNSYATPELGDGDPWEYVELKENYVLIGSHDISLGPGISGTYDLGILWYTNYGELAILIDYTNAKYYFLARDDEQSTEWASGEVENMVDDPMIFASRIVPRNIEWNSKALNNFIPRLIAELSSR